MADVTVKAAEGESRPCPSAEADGSSGPGQVSTYAAFGVATGQ